MACDCITKMDEKLKEHNSRVCVTFVHNRETRTLDTRIHLQTSKINSRCRSKTGIIATFCPFCGIRYLPVESIQLQESAA